jgi:isopenicillin-N epimerase
MTDTRTRRDFFRDSLAGSALLAGTAAGAIPLPAFGDARPSGAGTADRDYWAIVRAQFSFTEDTVPMNAANLCPSFRGVASTVADLTADIDRDCSFDNRARFDDLREATRSRIAAQLGVDADEIALVRNTSEANNLINSGLDLQAGDEVLLWDQNHQTNNVAWDVRAARYGIRVKRISTPENPGSPQELADTFIASLGPRTKVLSLSHVSNVSGVRLPIRSIAEAAKARDIYVHLDGAQTWGAMALDLRDLGVDSYAASAHKWYMGPKEVGLLYIAKRNHDRVWPAIIAPGWGDDAVTDLVGARRFESLGQRDDAALAALGVAAELHDTIGASRIEARITQLTQRLKEGIAEAGLELVTPMGVDVSFGIGITRAPRERRRAILKALYEEHGIAGAPTGGIRLCPHIYNTEEHVDRAVAAVTAQMQQISVARRDATVVRQW